jgi:23S rRNA pseudouridine1911/1915/1917 synthase
MVTTEYFSTKIPETMQGKRLDQVLPLLFPDYSRACLQKWIQQEQVWINDKHWRGKDKVTGGEMVRLKAEMAVDLPHQAEAMALDILYQDDSLLVINKPAGLVVHPGAGNAQHTLVNALLHHDPDLDQIPRAGIVHRLDKDTSGVLVVARTLAAHHHLVEQLQARTVKRIYRALVNGIIIAGGTVDAPIARHPRQRTKMAVVSEGKPAITHYRVIERFKAHTYLKVQLETGRTHQIRVHMAYKNHPVVGDGVYGGRVRLPSQPSEELMQQLRHFTRQALHAHQLELIHPKTQETLSWRAPVPDDMRALLAALRDNAAF